MFENPELIILDVRCRVLISIFFVKIMSEYSLSIHYRYQIYWFLCDLSEDTFVHYVGFIDSLHYFSTTCCVFTVDFGGKAELYFLELELVFEWEWHFVENSLDLVTLVNDCSSFCSHSIELLLIDVLLWVKWLQLVWKS